MPFYRTPIKTTGLLLLFWLSGSLIVVVTMRVSPVQAAPTELFFSEYIEGTSNNKALEIFNGTGALVDLSAYRVELYSNGSLTASQAITLTGTLSDSDVFVLAHGAAGSAILAVADMTSSSVVNFNGDDAVVLKHNGVIIDVIGQIGVDPGTEWGTGLTSTADNTLRRKVSIQAGDANGSDAFNPAIEWDGFAVDTFGGLGTHVVPTPTPTDTPTSTSTPVPATDTPTFTSTPTDTPIPPTSTPTFTPIPTDTDTPIPPTDTPTPTFTPAVIDTLTPVSATDTPMFTPVATDTPTATATPTSTFTPIPTDTSTPIPATDTPTFTPVATDTPTSVPVNTPTTAETITPTITSTLLPGVTDTPTVTGTAAVTLTVTVTATAVLPTDTPTSTPTVVPPSPGEVVINEVAWSGTTSSANDEWIELYNVSPNSINLANWTLSGNSDGQPVVITLTGVISAGGYFLLERQDNNSVSDILADQIYPFNNGLDNNGESLFLKAPGGVIIDTANGDGGPWPGGTNNSAGYRSMERKNALMPDSDSNWVSNDASHRNGRDANNNDTINGTPKQPNSILFPTTSPVTPTPPSPAAPPILISEFLYDGITSSTEGDEFVELCNPNPFPVDLTSYKVGDEETRGGGESMVQLPISTTLQIDGCLVIARNAAQFQARFGLAPTLEVASLSKYTAWGTGSWSLANDGDELLVLGPSDQILDSVAYRNGNYAALGLEADASAPEPLSLQRVWPTDTNSMPNDFVRTDPNPGQTTLPPLPPATILPPATLPDGMYAYWGDLHAHSSYSDGSGPPHYALAVARAAGLHFQAITDHDWRLTALTWAKILTQTTNATVPGQFVALRGVEWTNDAAGHINVFNSDTLLNSRNDPMFSSLPDFYSWLAAHPEVIAQFNHPDPSYGGTFFNFAYHSGAAQGMFMQEIGNNAQGYTTYEPSFVQSNMAGWHVGPTNNSDHHQAHWGSQSSARTGLVAPALTESDLLAAMRARRVFATEDSNLAVALRVNGAWMGSSLSATGPLPLTVDVVDPDAESLTLYVYDSNLLLTAVPLTGSTGQWSATVQARPGHFFWAKVVQADGNTAYTAPVWIEGQAVLERLVINEILPAPYDWDWDGDGHADYRDEWIELYNPTDQPVGLGGWQVADSTGAAYNIPLAGIIPARGFAVFYRALTGFSLNNDAETVTLTHPNGTVVDTFSYVHSPGYDESYCRLPDAGTAWSDNCAPSPQAANGEKVPAGPLTSKIFDAKHLTDNAWVRVKGHITAPPGLLGTRTMYIQDSTSGIKVYLPKDHRYTFALGDRVEVVGHLRTFHEEFEIVVSQRGDIKFLEHGEPLPPLPIATTSLLEPYEGMLAMLQGQAVDFKGRTTLWLDDGTGWAKTYILKTTGINKPFINRGDPLTMVGIVSQYSDEDDPSRNDYRLLPRYQTDLVVTSVAPAPANWPALLPETGY